MVGMPIPDFIVELRRHVEHALLWLPAVTAVVVRGQQILLVKRSDNGAWTPVTGIVEPGENPADCAVREVLEESGVHAVARRLAWVHVTSPVVHVNGDHAQYLDHVFRMDWVDGEPFPADDESVEAGWFDLAALPAVSAPCAEGLRSRVTRMALRQRFSIPASPGRQTTTRVSAPDRGARASSGIPNEVARYSIRRRHRRPR
ncbi:MAG: putative MutT/NUDIX-family protein [Mycobacterium sp.]|nr:putative MutT/NUDIX-family protein [Mycobacterium sp.]